ncbi:MAG: hypothetical protein ACLGPL_02895 [Acidobacteriota bacterium]
MKNPKRSFDLEDHDMDSSKDFGIDLGRHDADDDDDEIIDLDDMIELSDDSDLNLDSEILDADGDLSFDDMKFDSSENDDALEEELLKEFSLELGDSSSKSPQGKKSLDDEDDILRQFASGKGDDADPMEGDGDDILDDLSFLEEKDMKQDDDDLAFLLDKADDLSGSAVKDDAPSPVHEPVESASPVEAMVADISGEALGSLDDLVSRIEEKLVESIRSIVEARLPEIVRTVLREEIELMRDEEGR